MQSPAAQASLALGKEKNSAAVQI